jgi:hypothetical protein
MITPASWNLRTPLGRGEGRGCYPTVVDFGSTTGSAPTLSAIHPTEVVVNVSTHCRRLRISNLVRSKVTALTVAATVGLPFEPKATRGTDTRTCAARFAP